MKKIILIMFLFLLIPTALSFDIAREFSNNGVNAGEEVDVKLIATISGGEEVYVIEESVPDGIEVTDEGDGSYANGKMRWVIMNDIQDTYHYYKIKGINGGTYIFKGVYSLDGQDEVVIGGDETFNIRSTGSSQGSSNTGSSNTATTPSNNNTNLTNLNSSNTNKKGKIYENVANVLSEKTKIKNSRIFFWVVPVIIILSLLVVGAIIYFAVKMKKKIKIEWIVFWITLAIIVGGILWVLLV